MEIPTSIDVLLHLNQEITAAIGVRRCSLSQLNITPELLPSDQQKNLRAAAEGQCYFQRMETPEDLILEQARAEKEMAYVKYAIQRLQESNENSVDVVAALKNELELANEDYRVMNEMIVKKNDEAMMKFLVKKQDEYVKKAVAIQERMLNSGITDVNQYSIIIDNANTFYLNQTKLAQLSLTFKKYNYLPPNIQDARETIAEAKSTLKVLEQKLKEQITSNLN